MYGFHMPNQIRKNVGFAVLLVGTLGFVRYSLIDLWTHIFFPSVKLDAKASVKGHTDMSIHEASTWSRLGLTFLWVWIGEHNGLLPMQTADHQAVSGRPKYNALVCTAHPRDGATCAGARKSSRPGR